jgi:hypothetical protein
VCLVNFSITLRSANWASDVIESASSSMTSFTPELNSLLVPANSLIWSRTTSMPRSSEAFSCGHSGEATDSCAQVSNTWHEGVQCQQRLQHQMLTTKHIAAVYCSITTPIAMQDSTERRHHRHTMQSESSNICGTYFKSHRAEGRSIQLSCTG